MRADGDPHAVRPAPRTSRPAALGAGAANAWTPPDRPSRRTAAPERSSRRTAAPERCGRNGGGAEPGDQPPPRPARTRNGACGAAAGECPAAAAGGACAPGPGRVGTVGMPPRPRRRRPPRGGRPNGFFQVAAACRMPKRTARRRAVRIHDHPNAAALPGASGPGQGRADPRSAQAGAGRKRSPRVRVRSLPRPPPGRTQECRGHGVPVPDGVREGRALSSATSLSAILR